MSTATVADAVRAPRAVGKVTQARVINSEWIKFRTLRSTFWTLFVAVGLMVGVGLMFAFFFSSDYATMSAHRRAEFNPITDPLRGYNIAQLAVGILGVIVITGEYTTGMIRASLSAVPHRLPVLWAKMLVFSVIVLVVTTVTSVLTFVAAQGIFSSKHIQASFSSPQATRIVLGTGLYLTFVGLLGIALGAIIRTTAGGIAALVGLLMVVPIIGELLSATTWGADIQPYLPSNAGQALLTTVHDSSTMAPWTGFGLFAGYTVLAVAVAAYLLKRRDA